MKKIVFASLGLLFSLLSVAQVPVNDECSGALGVTPSIDSSRGVSVVTNSTGATQSMTGCSGLVQHDVWFKFTATSTRHRVNISTANDITPWLQVFGGTCGSLQSFGCWTLGPSNITNFVATDLLNLTPGATYYYRTYSMRNTIGFNISTYVTTLPTSAVNDDCSGAVALPVNADQSCTDVYTGNLEFSTQSRPSCLSSGKEARDLWYSFVATSTSHRITVTPLTNDNYVFEVFSGTCNGLTSIACVNPGAVVEPDIALLSNLIAGNTYYIRVYDYFGGSSGNQRFGICISTSDKILDNDECSGALAVTPSPGAYPGPSVPRYTFGATQSMPGCFGTADDDIWFKFTATAKIHRVEVAVNTNVVVPVLEIFNGTCGSLQSIVCRYANPSYSWVSIELANLTPGTTYYYRTYDTSSIKRTIRFSTYILTPSASPLPVTLGDFTVKADNGKNLLKWKTISETNNAGFQIEYSMDGIHFNSLHFVTSNSGNGNSSVPQNYSYEHDLTGVGAARIYYRLKQIDYDQREHYSSVVLAEAFSKENISISNPVRNSVKISMPETLGYRFVIYNYSGRICKQGVLEKKEILVPELTPGNYVLRLFNDAGANVVLKFLKL